MKGTLLNMSYNGIILNGATAVGKTSISIKIAKKLNMEIISADSTQIYKELDILTAKIKKEEMQGIKHHLIDFVDVLEDYSVGNFKEDTDKILNDIFPNEVMVVGGTGLYTNVLNKGMSKLPEKNEKLRNYLEKKDINELQEMLKQLDEKTYFTIDLNNKVRLVRAVEICLLTDKKFSELVNENNLNHKYIFFNVLLTRDRDDLYNRINYRVDEMLKNGAIDEAYGIFKKYDEKMLDIKAIGYRQMYMYFKNQISFETMVEEIKKESRRYAKRQITWFKNKGYFEINLSEIKEDEAIEIIIKKYKEGIK